MKLAQILEHIRKIFNKSKLLLIYFGSLYCCLLLYKLKMKIFMLCNIIKVITNKIILGLKFLTSCK